jgi:adenosylcobinamide-phosphate synthase
MRQVVWSMSAALAVICAFAIDVRLGEPRARWHPVVWIGRALGSCGAPWADVAPRTAFRRGVMVWLALALASAGAGAAVTAAVLAITGRMTTPGREVLQALLLGLSLKPLLAWQLLHDEVAAVDVALETSLDAGRSRLRRLCSRDASALSATQVRESALESLAENLNDSVVAPLFWFVLGGLPAAALYRFANTADAMWGYRGRFEWAGKCSARADDLLSYVPARITALLLALAAPCWPRGLRREAGRTPSPNGGWPMAMLALALDVRLTKPGVYVLHEVGRPERPSWPWPPRS